MFSFLRRRRAVPSAVAESAQRSVEQALRLELADTALALSQAQADLDYERRERRAAIERSVQAKLDALMSDLAPAATQLELQRSIAHRGIDPPLRDVLVVAGRLLDTLRGVGLEFIGSVRATESFDPRCHSQLDSSFRPQSGEAVVVRVPGVKYGGRVLVTAGVDRVEGA